MKLEIKNEIAEITARVEAELQDSFRRIDETALYNQQKVLQAFIDHRVSVNNFNPTTGYGYDDTGRDTLDAIYADVFRAEDALVRHNIVNGTHCIAIALFAVLRPGDTLLAVTGKPYDTLEEVIGISGDGGGSLKEFGVNYEQVDLIGGAPDYEGIKKALHSGVKAVIIQRSKGYDWRETISVEEIGKIIACVRSVKPDTVCIVDNCYGELVEKREPTEVDADLVVGSLIKNIGGGLAQTGGYIAGKAKYVELASYRQTCPGLGKEVGATLGQNRFMYQGLFMAPHAVAQALKAAALCGGIMEALGYEVNPRPTDVRCDIIQAIKFNDEDKLIKFIQAIQSASPVDSFALPLPWDMPGYQHQVIMAAGTFVSGASIELSADAPIKPPYVGFMQGGLTYESAKIAIMHAASAVL
ncbi:MAG: methionine gamma-lyase family protein [Oscillospiraceae bacterium]|nr:methionine gamma-lyase family protein [Oscillospiraceae bacterium]